MEGWHQHWQQCPATFLTLRLWIATKWTQRRCPRHQQSSVQALWVAGSLSQPSQGYKWNCKPWRGSSSVQGQQIQSLYTGTTQDLELPVWTVGRSLSRWRGATQRLDGETCKLPSERAELILKLALKSLYNINRCRLYIMNIESITPTYVKGIWTAFKLQSVLPHIRILLAARWLTVRVQFTWSLLLLCAGRYVTKLKKINKWLKRTRQPPTPNDYAILAALMYDPHISANSRHRQCSSWPIKVHGATCF